MPLVAADLVVEDGTGLDNANAYLGLVEAAEYHRLRANAAWDTATEAAQVAALINATQYVDIRWSFIGDILVDDPAQALSWPRDGGADEPLYDRRGVDVAETVPLAVRQATAEYALRALAGALLPDPTVPDEAGRFVSLKREKLGPLEEETRFSDTRAVQTTRKYPEADRLLRQSGLLAELSDRAGRA